MASVSLVTFKLTTFRPRATYGNRKPDSNNLRKTSAWWTPLFGWSSDPDYIVKNETVVEAEEIDDQSADSAASASRFALGCFTEEKAKQLRKKTNEMANFHDIMYYSAIASRLASDLTDRDGN